MERKKTARENPSVWIAVFTSCLMGIHMVNVNTVLRLVWSLESMRLEFPGQKVDHWSSQAWERLTAITFEIYSHWLTGKLWKSTMNFQGWKRFQMVYTGVSTGGT